MLWPLLVAIALGGCGPKSDANIYGSLNGQRVVGNEAYVTVSNVWNEMDALPFAEQHCSKYGKIAQYVPSKTFMPTFNCIAKNAR